MSCVRDSSPPEGSEYTKDGAKQEPKKRRSHPLLSLLRIFRRKPRVSDPNSADGESPHGSREGLGVAQTPDEQPRFDAQYNSRSASQLTHDSSQHRRSLHSTVLSVSHDSVFSPELHEESQLGSVQSVQKLGPSNIRAELFDAVRRRKVREDTSEEDLGLPRSPLSNSLTTTDALSDANKEVRIAKSPHSTCSDGSLLSMGSSEMDEDFYGHGSKHSSKLSLYDRKSISQESDAGVDLNSSVTTTQLSHSAARHKMAIKPKRTHGAPRRNKQLTVGSVLPSTPELNEDITGRTPSSQITDSASTNALSTSTEPSAEVRIKSASLPSGLSPISSTCVKLIRSRSNAACLSANDNISEEDEDTENVMNHGKKDDSNSFFGRLLSRRSGKKKKVNEESLKSMVPPKRLDDKGRYVHEISNVSVKHYPATRQRVDPINIPSDCNPVVNRMHVSYPHFPPTVSDLEGGVVVHSVNLSDKVEVVHTKPVFHDLPDVLKPVKKSFSFRCNDQSSYNSLDSISLPVTVNSSKDDADGSSDAVENKIGVRNVSITEEMVPTILLSSKNLVENKDTRLTSSSNSEITQLTSESHKIVITSDNPSEITEINNIKSIEIPNSLPLENSDIVISSPNQVSTVILSESPETIKLEKELFNPTKMENCANIIISDPLSVEPTPKSPKILPCLSPKFPITPPSELSFEDVRKSSEEICPPVSPRSIDISPKIHKVPEPVLPPVPAPRTSILKKDPENSVPEFMKIQLNRIENKSFSNVILATSPEKSEKSGHPEVQEKPDKIEKSKKPDKADKPEKAEKPEKPEKLEKNDKPSTPEKSEKFEKLEKLENFEENEKFVRSEKREVLEKLPKIETCVKAECSDKILESKLEPLESDSIQIEKPIITEAIHKSSLISTTPLNYVPPKFTVNMKQWSSVNANNQKTSISHVSEIMTDQVKPNKKQFDQNEAGGKPVLSSSIKVILRSHSSVDEDSVKLCDKPTRSNSIDNMRETIIVYNDSKQIIKSETETKLKETSNKKLSEQSISKSETCPNVVFRRKSDSKEVNSSKDDEPELLKVFARRSLKIKDADLVESCKLSDCKSMVTKSRDSDKENEEMDSPPEERKFKEMIKSDLENETSTKPVFNFISNVNSHFSKPDPTYSVLNTFNTPTRYHRSLSHNADDLSNTILLLSNQRENHNINNSIFEKRQRSKTLPDLQTQKNVSNSLFLCENENNNISPEKPETTQKFKRIQQRAEEWERRAQSAMNKTPVE